MSKIAVSREKDEIEINEYNDLQTIAAANTEDAATARYLVDMVYDDLDFCNNAMDYKVEIDAMRIGSNGIQTFPKSIEGDMATEDVINFNVPKENFIGVKVAWSDAEKADGLKDVADAAEKVGKKGLKNPSMRFWKKPSLRNLSSRSPLLADCSLATTKTLSPLT